MLLGRDTGFDVCTNDGRKLKSVNIPLGHITSIQYYNDNIYALCQEQGNGTKRHVLVFKSSNYKRIKSWPVPDYRCISNIAVVKNKVYVSDTANKRIAVYSITGDHSSYVTDSTFNSPDHICIGRDCSVIVSDWKADKVCRLDGKIDKIRWICDKVKTPRGVCCDTNGDVWVWSEHDKSIFVLSHRTGQSLTK